MKDGEIPGILSNSGFAKRVQRRLIMLLLIANPQGKTSSLGVHGAL